MPIEVSAIEARLRAFEEWKAIHDHQLRYAHLLDTRRNDRVAEEIFTADAVIDFGTGRVQGREAIHAFYMNFADALLGTAHLLTNFHIEVEGDRARSLCRSMAWHWLKSPDPLDLHAADILGIGGYQDELRREAEGWRISQRVTVQFGTGIGVGTPPAEIRPIFEGLMGRLPTWPK
jgi:hypothetical protein